MKQFVISETFASGFSLALMAKDLRIAADLSKLVGLDPSNAETIAAFWENAKAALDKNADHTDIYRFIASAGSISLTCSPAPISRRFERPHRWPRGRSPHRP